ncbi:hypothetical protein UFOVP1288_63 [uncultured Caudovirales phage]|uniref:Uncharacterized protein n=1 Tax=uncultured Caudovirales phage TaxID=2100421 RepID=A0A6J5RAA5_9CAUD|nr:hypothetical protein UFOVP1195_63 [uncultured Caudovirales phage]CAB4196150.1 hypothetical protein UFOVP1288_63 [uncultured Caudovirales phage]CAB4205157.1 hypothetical protein UFOVP1409_63 [uncultured Caudovirales phage]
MAQVTFSGPIRSLNGLYTRGPGSIITNTASTLTITPQAHGGRIIYNNVATTTITLPAVDVTAGATGDNPNNLGVVYTFYIAATATAVKIRTTSSSPGDLFVGSLVSGKDGILTAGGTATFIPNGSSNDVISMNGTTTGGIAGSYLSVVAVATNTYLVQGVLIGSGTLATPFADS